MKTSIAIAALVATSIGLAAVPASAQETITPAGQWDNVGGNQLRLSLNGDRNGPRALAGPGMALGSGGLGRGGLIALACSSDGAEALDVALLRMSYRLELTDTQKPLFETFRTKALTTQTSFADKCKTLLPAKSADTKPDMLTMLKARLAVDQERLTAVNEVLPDFEALYNSLTDQQKDALMPHRATGMFGGGKFHKFMDQGDQGRGPRPPALGRN